jgi:hypothetical protein
MAFLRDIGYVTVVPEPSIAALMTSAGLLLWRRRIAVV